MKIAEMGEDAIQPGHSLWGVQTCLVGEPAPFRFSQRDLFEGEDDAFLHLGGGSIGEGDGYNLTKGLRRRSHSRQKREEPDGELVGLASPSRGSEVMDLGSYVLVQ